MRRGSDGAAPQQAVLDFDARGSREPPRGATGQPLDSAAVLPVVRRSARARRLSVRVFGNGHVEVVAPTRAGAGAIASFITRHRAWIERARQRVTRQLPAAGDAVFPPPQVELRAFGEVWRIHNAAGTGPAAVRVLTPGLLAWRGPPESSAASRRLLLRWLTGRTRTAMGAWLASLAAELGVTYSGWTLRRQRSRWGSCSSRGTISLNVCLAFQRPEVVRYLMIHELTHREHMNHSAHFWNAVERRCPEWRVLDRELRHGWQQVPRWVFE